MQESRVRSLDWEDPLEKEMAAYSNILAWKIPWTVEAGRLLSMGSQGWTRLSNFTFTFTNIHTVSLGKKLKTCNIKKYLNK